jgi:D-lactate dehydrogenase (cytochrome)
VADLLDQLRGLVGAAHVLTGADAAPFLTDWRKRFTGKAHAVVRPASAQQVADVVKLCAHTSTPIVPQGGNTGLVGGATPDASGNAIVLSLARMNKIRGIDAANNTLIAEAGCVLQTVQEAAAAQGRLFPLSLAAEGSATIGGNLSTNAGGTQVLRYGNARELCLGLEVVTPRGELWDGLTGLRKNNTGYDLRDLFIGAEGTLGIITAACVKLFPLPRAQVTALAALNNVEDAVTLLGLAQAHCGPTLTGFELFSEACLKLVEKHFSDHRSPFGARHPQYVLLELSDHESEAHAQQLLESTMQTALERGLAQDAVIAQSQAQSRALWELREHISEAQALEGKNIKHDISVPISRIAAFVQETDALLQQHFAGMRMVTFGHLGDGNLHYNVSPPEYGSRNIDAAFEVKMAEKAHEYCADTSETLFLSQQSAIYQCVHDQVRKHAGSISAEHGIGQLKREELLRYKSEVELRLMRVIKLALDPLNIMNPGKVL